MVSPMGCSVVRAALGLSLTGGLLACDDTSNPPTKPTDTPQAPAAPEPSGLPPKPSEWVCADAVSEAELDAKIETWCAAPRSQGKSPLGPPQPLSQLKDKNAFDKSMAEFLNSGEYSKKLGWEHDEHWRLTGPCVGETNDRCEESYGVHPAVRIWYSPEVIDWLCAGREGALPDGSMIVKEMHSLASGLKIGVDAKSCMSIQDAPMEADSWTLMIKRKSEAFDGWYWAGISRDASGNPPIVDASAFVDAKAVPADPDAPVNTWFPTGDMFGAAVPGGAKVSNVVYPYNMFGNYCLNCHASAVSESTYSTLRNVLGLEMQYKWFADPTKEDPPSAKIPAGSLHGEGSAAPDTSDLYVSPFSAALPDADPAFVKFFDQLSEVSYAQAWTRRLPAETYDHVPSGPEGPSQFLTSDQCVGCHDATASNASTPNMQLAAKDPKRMVNLSPYAEWRASPMGLAGRDPIFFSQLQSETNNLPALTECIETTCLHCHGVMGQRQLSIDTEPNPKCEEMFGVKPPTEVPFGDPFRLSMVTQWSDSQPNEEQKYGALARDGISCTACHHIADQELGDESTFTGNFVTGAADILFGPFEDVVTKPMEHTLGVTPKKAAQMSDSKVCGTCHAILLPKVTNAGKIVGYSFEQTTFLEWQNSDSGRGPDYQSCQDCHMPHTFKDEPLTFEIANIESSAFAPTDGRLPDADITLTPRAHYRRHALHGLNVFLNEMFQQFPLLLGLRQIDYMTGSAVTPPLITGEESMLHMAKHKTATVRVEEVVRSKDDITVSVNVLNQGGHFFPSGVGFRRSFLEVVAVDGNGTALWASGRTNSLGVLVQGLGDTPLDSELPLKHPKAFQRHYTKVTAQDQVQIYEEVIADSEGAISTSFLRRIETLKDNRVRPKGFDPEYFAKSESPFVQALAYECPGGDRADMEDKRCQDPDYADPKRTGQDQLTYVIALDPASLAQVANINVTLYYQAIPPAYLQERFRDANRGPKEKSEIERLYYLTSHLNTAAEDLGDSEVIPQWKLELAATSAPVTAGATP
ncbi:MAG: hypothetical protein KUG77_15630 [Nannocystaceae bacterium]|nr:hypothetical protein [Nannocystaceae bacterium]